MAYFKNIDRFGNEILDGGFPIGQYAMLAPGGGGFVTVTANTTLAFDTLVSSYGSLVVPTAASSQLTLAAGYVYEIEAAGLFYSTNATSALSYGIWNGTALIGTQAYVHPTSHSTALTSNQTVARAYVSATANTTVTVRAIQIVSAGATTISLQSPTFPGYGGSATNYNGTIYNGYFTAKVIGII